MYLMHDPMIDTFGHHVIPLLPLPGEAGAIGGKAHLAVVKGACKFAERIHGALKMAGRFELAVIPVAADLFDPSPGMAKVRNLALDTIRITQHLQWVTFTRNPEFISGALPPTWIGKGFQNICIGLLAGGDDDFAEKLEALRNAPVRCRMILLTPASPPIDLAGQLHDIDWVVFSGRPDDGSDTEAIESACHMADVPFYFHQPELRIESCSENDSLNNEPPWLIHPFGTKIQLFRPTLASLKSVAASIPMQSTLPAGVDNKPEESSSAAMTSTDHPIDSTRETNGSIAEPPTEVIDLEVVTPDLSEPDPNTDLPVNSDADTEDFERLDGVVRRGLSTFIEVGQALAEIRDRELWRTGGYVSWAVYCIAIGGLSKTHANRLINSSAVASYLVQVTPIGVTPTAESQVRPLCKLKQPEQQVLAWTRAAERANGPPTAKLIIDVIAEIMAKETPPTVSKPSRKELLAETFGLLRSAISSKQPANHIETLITDLETLLKLR